MAAHGGSAASSALKGLIQQFTTITEKKFVPQFLKSRKYWWNQNHYLVLLKDDGLHVQFLMVSGIFKLKLFGKNKN
ncbi:UBXN7 isoform 2 [Pan troglodytes]|uniref:UBX domain protein 7 n=3 Tax=Pan TaxID=9596 RepID=A0A2I3RAQ0_PANTR|nr:UBXN7 isoform 2 [Pan troglodytes]